MSEMVINLLIGTKDSSVSEVFAKKLSAELSAEGIISVGMVDIAVTRNKLTEGIQGSNYDVVICSEEIGDAKVGTGSIRNWMGQNPNVRIILVMNDEKRGGDKVKSFLTDIQYYDALFLSDFTTETISRLLQNSRTRAEAIDYYGIEADEVFQEENGNEPVDESYDGEGDDLLDELLGSINENVVKDEENGVMNALLSSIGNDEGSKEESNMMPIYDSREESDNKQMKQMEKSHTSALLPVHGNIVAVINDNTLIWETDEEHEISFLDDTAGTHCHLLIPFSQLLGELTNIVEKVLPRFSGPFEPSLVPIDGFIIAALNKTSLLVGANIGGLMNVQELIQGCDAPLILDM